MWGAGRGGGEDGRGGRRGHPTLAMPPPGLAPHLSQAAPPESRAEKGTAGRRFWLKQGSLGTPDTTAAWGQLAWEGDPEGLRSDPFQEARKPVEV